MKTHPHKFLTLLLGLSLLGISAAHEQKKDDSIKGIPVALNAAKPMAAQAGCNSEDLRGQSSVRVEDIVGMYRQSVNLPPHSSFLSDGKPSGYNYLALTSTGSTHLRVRLVTKEINGHECSLDNQALLCGRSIQIIPSDEEESALERVQQPAPKLRISPNSILFAQKSDGNYVWGNPYCGALGGLYHSFKRATRNQTIDNSVFSQ